MKLPGLEKLGAIGLVGERKAVALLFLGFYSTLFFMISLSARTELPEYVPMITGLMIIYLISFFGVAADWFWGRWVATGVGYWGLGMALWTFGTIRTLPPALVIFGATHGLIALCLQGERMIAAYDAQTRWRERFKLDDAGVLRVRKSVTRAASSLPSMVLYILAPRQTEGSALLLLLAVAGISGLLMARTAGVFLLISAGVGSLVMAFVAPAAPMEMTATAQSIFGGLSSLMQAPVLLGVSGVLLLASALPFARPVLRFLRNNS